MLEQIITAKVFVALLFLLSCVAVYGYYVNMYQPVITRVRHQLRCLYERDHNPAMLYRALQHMKEREFNAQKNPIGNKWLKRAKYVLFCSAVFATAVSAHAEEIGLIVAIPILAFIALRSKQLDRTEFQLNYFLDLEEDFKKIPRVSAVDWSKLDVGDRVQCTETCMYGVITGLLDKDDPANERLNNAIFIYWEVTSDTELSTSVYHHECNHLLYLPHHNN